MPTDRFPPQLFRAIGAAGLLVSLALAAAAQDGPASEETRQLQKAVQEAVQKAEPSVVSIWVTRSEAYAKLLNDAPLPDRPGELGGFDRTEAKKKLEAHFKDPKRLEAEVKKLDLADPDNLPESYASGVVVSAKGLVLTNFHVVRDATKIYVRLPGDKGSYANIHAADHRSDLAVLRLLNSDVLPLRPIQQGEGEKVRTGHFVVTMANPFAAGFRDGSPTSSWGMVGNLRQRAPNRPPLVEQYKITLHHYGTLLEIKAGLPGLPLGPSGGAVLNLNGEMIGLTNSLAGISGDEKGGLAIPLDAAMRRIIAVLEKGEEVEYGFLGIIFPQDAPPAPAGKFAQAIPGGPAYEAGLQGETDTITEVEGFPVGSTDDLVLAVSTLLAGTKANLKVRRGFALPRDVTVTLAKSYQPAENFIASNKPPFVHGLRVEWNSILAQTDRSLMRIPPGVFVREVQPGSAADKAELQNAIISHVNGQPVATPAEFLKIAKVNGPIELTLTGRDGRETKKIKLD